MALMPSASQKVRCKVVEFDIADLPVGEAVPALALPGGAEVVGGSVSIETPFNAGTTDILDVGDAGNGARYLNDGNIHAAGRVPLVPTGLKLASRTVLTLTRNQTGAAATAGKGRMSVEFIIHGSSDEIYD